MPEAAERFGSPEHFERLAREALDGLPRWFRERVENVAFFVEELPDDETLAHLGLDDPFELLGLYRGTPLPQRVERYGYANLPDTVHLYRRPILAWCRAHGEDLAHCIRHVVTHELGHYIGLSDDDMERIEAGAAS